MMKYQEITKYLPHRYPFLLVDRVLELEKERIVTYKNVSANEDFFNGHFPGQPIMPGVLQVEALAQSGCIMLLDGQTEDISDKLVVFSGIKNARFRQQVVPGDQLMMEVDLLNFRRNFATMHGIAKVDGKVACELEATAAIIKRDPS
jgi:3-hydroxyacyl-[acyl-carrier-protein] dehydratase